MKTLFLAVATSLALGLGVVSNASAQNLVKMEGVVGLNVSDIGDLGSKAGLAIGVRAEVPIKMVDSSPHAPGGAHGPYLNAGVLFSMKGFDMDWGDLGGQTCYANFLDIPIHVGYRYAINNDLSVFGEVGPYFAVGLFGKTKLSDYEFDTFDEGSMKRFDVGAGLRFGMEFRQKFCISFGYDWGFIDLDDRIILADNDDIDLTPSMKTETLNISLGYKF